MPCPNCGAQVQVDANFCGQCGFSIQVEEAVLPTALETPMGVGTVSGLEGLGAEASSPNASYEKAGGNEAEPGAANAGEPVSQNLENLAGAESMSASLPESAAVGPGSGLGDPGESLESAPVEGFSVPRSASVTQLQSHHAVLLHVRTNVEMTLPENLPVVHIGKPNDRIPPDIDVSGFPDSEVVSRVHADIRVEGDAYYIEDLGSSNGTYINNLPLVQGNRHRLRMGDRIALGKGDLVTFLFQVT